MIMGMMIKRSNFFDVRLDGGEEKVELTTKDELRNLVVITAVFVVTDIMFKCEVLVDVSSMKVDATVVSSVVVGTSVKSIAIEE